MRVNRMTVKLANILSYGDHDEGTALELQLPDVV